MGRGACLGGPRVLELTSRRVSLLGCGRTSESMARVARELGQRIRSGCAGLLGSCRSRDMVVATAKWRGSGSRGAVEPDNATAEARKEDGR